MCLFTTYSKNIMAYCDVVEDLFIWVVVLRSIKPISFCDVTEITIVSVIFIL